MPSEGEHRVRAKRNEKFAASLNAGDPVEENWAVVAVFYSAVHYVEEYFATRGIHCSDHKSRNKQVFDRLGVITYKPYMLLYHLSRTARYECSNLPEGSYARMGTELATVKKNLAAAIGTSASAP